METLPTPPINTDHNNEITNLRHQEVPTAPENHKVQEINEIQVVIPAPTNQMDEQRVHTNTILQPNPEPLPAPAQPDREIYFRIEKDYLSILIERRPMIFKEKLKMIEESLMRDEHIDLSLVHDTETGAIYYKVFGKNEDGTKKHVMNVNTISSVLYVAIT